MLLSEGKGLVSFSLSGMVYLNLSLNGHLPVSDVRSQEVSDVATNPIRMEQS